MSVRDPCPPPAVLAARNRGRGGGERPYYPRGEATYRLTEVERETLRAMMYGARDVDIAGELCISVGTLHDRLRKAYRKLRVHNLLAALWAAGIVRSN